MKHLICLFANEYQNKTTNAKIELEKNFQFLFLANLFIPNGQLNGFPVIQTNYTCFMQKDFKIVCQVFKSETPDKSGLSLQCKVYKLGEHNTPHTKRFHQE